MSEKREKKEHAQKQSDKQFVTREAIEKEAEECAEKATCDTNLKDQSNGSYRLYEYFKKNPSSLVIAVSGLIAVLNAIEQLKNEFLFKKTLQDWGVVTEQITLDRAVTFSNVVYLLIVPLLLTIGIWLTFVYLKSSRTLRATKLICDYYIKEGKKLKKRCKLSGLSQEKKEVEALLRDSSRIKSDIRKKQAWLVFKLVFFTMCVALLLTVINICTDANVSFSSFVSHLVLYMCLFVTMLLMDYFGGLRIVKRKNIEELCKKSTASEYLERINVDEALSGKNMFSIRELLKDSTITNYIKNIIWITVFPCVCIVCLSYLPFENTGAQPIAIIDNQEYFVVYADQNKYYLEEANVIENNDNGKKTETLVVYTDKQRIVKTDDISIISKKFKHIQKATSQ